MRRTLHLLAGVLLFITSVGPVAMAATAKTPTTTHKKAPVATHATSPVITSIRPLHIVNRYSFQLLSRKHQVELLKAYFDFFTDYEKAHSADFFSDRARAERHAAIMAEMRELFSLLKTANAAELKDEGAGDDTVYDCFYGGWPSKLSPSGKACENPAVGNAEYADAAKGCDDGQFVCNPALFGDGVCITIVTQFQRNNAFRSCSRKSTAEGHTYGAGQDKSCDICDQISKSDRMGDLFDQVTNFAERICETKDSLQYGNGMCKSLTARVASIMKNPITMAEQSSVAALPGVVPAPVPKVQADDNPVVQPNTHVNNTAVIQNTGGQQPIDTAKPDQPVQAALPALQPVKPAAVDPQHLGPVSVSTVGVMDSNNPSHAQTIAVNPEGSNSGIDITGTISCFHSINTVANHGKDTPGYPKNMVVAPASAGGAFVFSTDGNGHEIAKYCKDAKVTAYYVPDFVADATGNLSANAQTELQSCTDELDAKSRSELANYMDRLVKGLAESTVSSSDPWSCSDDNLRQSAQRETSVAINDDQLARFRTACLAWMKTAAISPDDTRTTIKGCSNVTGDAGFTAMIAWANSIFGSPQVATPPGTSTGTKSGAADTATSN